MHQIAQNAVAERAERAPALQTALTWSADGQPGVALVDANRGARRRRDRDGIRADARRVTEWLSTRGKLPIEAIHDLVALGWLRGTRLLAKELGISRERAFELFMQAAIAILPYTAPKQGMLELGETAAGGLALGHFLAARAMGEALQSGRAASQLEVVSKDRQSLDTSNREVFHGLTDGGTAMELQGLPPRAAD